MKTDYDICRAPSIDLLIVAVKLGQREGWEVKGGVAVMERNAPGENFTVEFYQAMVKDEDDAT